MLTHLDESGRPRMVDVGGKSPTRRTAHARAIVRFPQAAARRLVSDGFSTAKGPVFQTAIVAGVMATKRTHELIPFCHPLALEDCSITIEMDGDDAVIDCRVSLHAKTGALALPAVITGTVVFDSDGDTHAGHNRRVARKRRAESLTR